jgi:hypothetical protein
MELNYNLPRVAPKMKGEFYAKAKGYHNLEKFDYSAQPIKNLDNLDYDQMIGIDISREGENGVIFCDLTNFKV